MNGISLPIPEVLIELARTSAPELAPFCLSYRVIWALSPQELFAQASASASFLPDGRVEFDMTYDGRDSFSVKGFLIRREAEIHVIGDRISPVTGTPRLFVLPLEAEYQRGNVRLLRGFMPEFNGRTLICRPVLLVPCEDAALENIESEIDFAEVNELVGSKISFLSPQSARQLV